MTATSCGWSPPAAPPSAGSGACTYSHTRHRCGGGLRTQMCASKQMWGGAGPSADASQSPRRCVPASHSSRARSSSRDSLLAATRPWQGSSGIACGSIRPSPLRLRRHAACVAGRLRLSPDRERARTTPCTRQRHTHSTPHARPTVACCSHLCILTDMVVVVMVRVHLVHGTFREIVVALKSR